MSLMVRPASSSAISAASAPMFGTVRSGKRPNLIMSTPTTNTSVMALASSGRNEEVGEIRVALAVLLRRFAEDDVDRHVELDGLGARDHVDQVALQVPAAVEVDDGRDERDRKSVV